MKYEIIINNPVIGVPITWLDKYCPDQFEIIWTTDRGGDGQLDNIKKEHTRYDAPVVNGEGLYKRIFIRWKPEAMPHVDEDGAVIYGKI